MAPVKRIGPRLLGRRYEADENDYRLEDYLDAHGAHTIDQSILDEPIGSLVGKSIAYLIAVIRFILSQHDTPPAPGPTPAPGPVPSPSGAVTWEDAAHLDQGDTPHCVGFGWAGWEACAPIEDVVDNADGNAIYYAAKKVDGQPGQENGSSVRSGAKVMQSRGKLQTYAFTTSIDSLVAWLTAHGPVVMGTDWTQDMFNPDADGRVAPTGPVAGGHCYLAIGYDPETELVRFRNSWGTGWGVDGDFFMHRDDVAELLQAQGEACAAVEV